jgi:hypothetical protein
MPQDGKSMTNGGLNNSILDMYKTFERPIKSLQHILEPVSHKIGTLVIGLEGKLNEKVLSNSDTLKKAGIWLALPKLYGVFCTSSGSSESCQDIFESIVLGYLVSPENSQVAEIFRKAMEWGHLITLVRDEVS